MIYYRKRFLKWGRPSETYQNILYFATRGLTDGMWGSIAPPPPLQPCMQKRLTAVC